MKRNKILILIVIFLLLFTVFASATRIKLISAIPPEEIIKQIKAQPYWIYFQVGRFYYNGGNIPKAIEMFEKTVEFNPDYAPGYHNLGVAFYTQQEYDKAEASLIKAVTVDESYGKGHYTLGVYYFERRQFDSAIASFDRVVELDDSDANAHFDLAQSYVARFRKAEFDGNVDYSDLENAFKHMNKAEELEPGFPHTKRNIEIIKTIIDARVELLNLE